MPAAPAQRRAVPSRPVVARTDVADRASSAAPWPWPATGSEGRRGLACSLVVHSTLLVLLWLIVPGQAPSPALTPDISIQSFTPDSALSEPVLEAALLRPIVTDSPTIGGSNGNRSRDSSNGSPAHSVISGTARSSAGSVAPKPGSLAVTGDRWPGGDGSSAGELVGALGSGGGAGQGRGHGQGQGDGVGDGTGNGFFGAEPTGQRYVYVLDCSRSMNHPHDSVAQTRFKRMKLELVRSLARLPAGSEFFFIFFNTQPLPMPAAGMLQATEPAMSQSLRWVLSVKADEDTEPTEALRMALRLKPDVIYFLTDGHFIHRVQQELFNLPSGQTTQIYTLGFETPGTPQMALAHEQLVAGLEPDSRELHLSLKEMRVVREAVKGETFLKNLASRHRGKFILIPHSEPDLVGLRGVTD